MTHYMIYFNREWVGARSDAWIRERGPLAQAVVDDMRVAGVYVLAGGLEEAGTFSVAPVEDGVRFADGRYDGASQWLGGFAVVRVPDEQAARDWAGKLAQACGWPQEVRRLVLELEEDEGA